MVELKIDPEFRDKIPPLTDAEFEQLRENILSDGEVYEPIAVWNGTIVDGHNRWKVIQEHPEIPYRTKDMDFADKWAAFEWMYKKQLGRRNLTDEQRTVLIGKMYEARKNSVGGDRGNQYTKEASAQNEHMAKPGRTADAIAEELGIGKETVKRAEKFSKGIDALKEENPEAAEKVLQGGSGVTKALVMGLPMMEPEERKEVADAILQGTPIKPKPVGWTKQDRKEREKLEEIIADMYDPSTVPEYTVNDLVDDIRNNAEIFVETIKSILSERSTILTDENKSIVADAITKHLIDEFLKVKRLVEK